MDSVAHKDLPPERLRCNRRTVFAWSAPLARAAAAADSLQEVRVACVADACRRVAFGFGTVAPLDAQATPLFESLAELLVAHPVFICITVRRRMGRRWPNSSILPTEKHILRPPFYSK